MTGERLDIARPNAESQPVGRNRMVGRSVLAAALAGSILLLGPAPAFAACSLKAVPVPVTMKGLRPKVAAKINGQDVELTLDSGAFFSGIDAKFATDQKMKPAPHVELGSRLAYQSSADTIGIDGARKETLLVVADQFQFVGASFKNVQFLTYGGLGGATGVLGQNFLHQLDVEYDFGQGAMRLIKPEGCGGANLAYWANGIPYSVLPLAFTEPNNPHTVATILINGVKMRAYFDTGASYSFITARAAANAGVMTSDPGVTEVGTIGSVNNRVMKAWMGRFASVKIGDEEIKNGLLQIGDANADDYDVLIGADFFLSHHIYVANSQDKLYFTYNGGPVFSPGRQ